MQVNIQYADTKDLDYLAYHDKHASKEMIERKINLKEIITIHLDGEIIGWLRYGYFWDNTPFMNMLYFDEKYREKGYGSKLVSDWEEKMKEKGYKLVMTSTLSNEQAQFFYRKLGYRDAGCLLLENEALEILFVKSLYSH